MILLYYKYNFIITIYYFHSMDGLFSVLLMQATKMVSTEYLCNLQIVAAMRVHDAMFVCTRMNLEFLERKKSLVLN